MLCQLKEKNVAKSSNYIDVNNLKYFTIKKINEKLEEGLYTRNFEVLHKQSKTSINIMHLQLLCWEDHTALNSNYFEKIISFRDLTWDGRWMSFLLLFCSY
jgi:hypothetical protein